MKTLSKVAVLSVVLLTSTTLSAARRGRPTTGGWRIPSCSAVNGSPVVALSVDGGLTLRPNLQRLSGIVYTNAVALTDTPNTLIAGANEQLYRSDDAGCSWAPFADLEKGTFPPYIAGSGGATLYAWSPNRDSLYRIVDRTVTRLVSPVVAIVGVGVSSDDARHLRLAGDNGAIYDSTDAGATWNLVGTLRTSAVLLYKVEFDPTDLRHAVAGTATAGAWTTFDGVNWSVATGMASSPRGDQLNVFNVVFSPADTDVVWAMGLDMAEGSGNGRHIYRSVDGGKSFTRAVDGNAEIVLRNGPLLQPHPTRTDVLYFTYGSYFQNYGTDLYQYNATTNVTRWVHHDVHGIDSIAFHPLEPSVMYFGLERVEGRN